MRRKLNGAAAILLSIVLLCGCTKSADSEVSQPAGGSSAQAVTGSSQFNGELEKNVTIRVLENDTAIERGYFKELIAAFNEKYKEQGITAIDANMDQYLDLANDGPYGYGPDVLYQANDILMKYVQGKHILPLPIDKLDCYGEMPEAAWKAYQSEIDGKVYTCGVPVNVQAAMLYYRKDNLPEDWETNWDDDQNGVPDMVESWNDMYVYSKQVKEEGNGKFGYMKSLYDPYFSVGYLFSYGGYVFGNENKEPSDIGLSAKEAEKGVWVVKQLAGIMNEECIDDTITRNSYTRMADGTYFATITTPDIYTTFIKELAAVYQTEGLSQEEAEQKAKENLMITDVPKLPASGDLTEENPELKEYISMGGVNGYAVSAYTKAPNACLAFVDFATGYDMLMKRSEMLGIAPARNDAAKAAGTLSEILYNKLEAGNIVVMPSIQEVAQIWTPMNTFFSDVAKDAFRTEGEQKYKDLPACKTGLQTVDQQIYDAIFTLSSE